MRRVERPSGVHTPKVETIGLLASPASLSGSGALLFKLLEMAARTSSVLRKAGEEDTWLRGTHPQHLKYCPFAFCSSMAKVGLCLNSA